MGTTVLGAETLTPTIEYPTMLFSWLTEYRREKILADPFPAEWERYLQEDMYPYAFLSPEERQRLHDLIQIFVAEKDWEGCGGLEITDEIRVSIAGQACLLLLGLEDHNFYKNVRSILVYPSGYTAIETRPGAAGIVSEGPSARLGEAWSVSGPLVLSWSDATQGGRSPDGHNVVLHEFAHKLDMRDGSADGVPRLPECQDQYDEWQAVMAPEYERLVALHERGRADILDGYGATSPAEFFAVATECFFEKPRPLREKHPRLYDVLARYYRQDTAARVEAALQAEREAARQAEQNEQAKAARAEENAPDDERRAERDGHDDTSEEEPPVQPSGEETAARVGTYLDRIREAPPEAGSDAA